MNIQFNRTIVHAGDKLARDIFEFEEACASRLELSRNDWADAWDYVDCYDVYDNIAMVIEADSYQDYEGAFCNTLKAQLVGYRSARADEIRM